MKFGIESLGKSLRRTAHAPVSRPNRGVCGVWSFVVVIFFSIFVKVNCASLGDVRGKTKTLPEDLTVPLVSNE